MSLESLAHHDGVGDRHVMSTPSYTTLQRMLTEEWIAQVGCGIFTHPRLHVTTPGWRNHCDSYDVYAITDKGRLAISA